MYRFALGSWGLLALTATALLASPPVPFSGKLAVDGTNFHGNALFAFSIVDQQGTEHWRHSDEDGDTLENFVLNGRYLVLLGGHGMKQLPADLFLEQKSLFLRVSVDLQDGQGMRLLSPDQRITSSPYSLAAEVAQLAQRATIANGLEPGSVTAEMLNQKLLQDLNRTQEIGEISRDMLPQDVRDDLNATITHERLAADVRADLNRTITHSHLSSELKADLNRTITKQMLGQDVLSDLNRTVLLSDLSAEVSQSINRPITRDMLPQDVLSDLNRTVTQQDLSPQVRADINATIGMNRLSTEVTEKLNQEKTTTNYNAPSVGSLLAVPYGSSAPSGYSLYQRGEPRELVWEEKAPVSEARKAYDGVEVLDGKIYFVGGHNGSAMDIAERYDPLNDTWETLASMSVARQAVASTVLNGKLYAIGGANNGNRLSSVEIYDPNTANWQSGTELPKGIVSATSISQNNFIYLVNGADDTSFTDSFLRFNSENNSWSTIANAPFAGDGRKLVFFENKIWAIGGYNSSTSVANVDSYDPSLDTWKSETSMTTARNWPVAWVASNRIYVAGGNNDSYLNSIETYDPTTKEWRLAGNFPENKYMADAVVLNDKVYVIAGKTASGVSNKVFAADLNASMEGVYDLYRKDGDAPVGTPVVQSEYADGSVTTAKLDGTILKYLKPEITSQPQASTIYVGGEGIVSFSAEGKYLTYQWKKDGVDLAGETNATLNISGANANLHEGNYSVVVSNDFGSVESEQNELSIYNVGPVDGLVGWWKFDEGSGRVAYDSSSNGHDGNLINGPTWTNGKIGGALSFDGFDDLVTLGNVTGGLFDLTLSAWVKTNDQRSESTVWKSPAILGTRQLSGSGSGEYLLGLKEGKLIWFDEIQSSMTYDTSQQIADNSWYSIVFTRSNTSFKFFIGGILKSETVGTSNVLPERTFDVGCSVYSGVSHFLGLIDDVRIYDRALSAEEVQALYNLGQ